MEHRDFRGVSIAILNDQKVTSTDPKCTFEVAAVFTEDEYLSYALSMWDWHQRWGKMAFTTRPTTVADLL